MKAKIQLPAYPSLQEALRPFAPYPERAYFLDPSQIESPDYRDYLTRNGNVAFDGLTAFIQRVATLANGGAENCEKLSVEKVIDNLAAIARGEETGDDVPDETAAPFTAGDRVEVHIKGIMGEAWYRAVVLPYRRDLKTIGETAGFIRVAFTDDAPFGMEVAYFSPRDLRRMA